VSWQPEHLFISNSAVPVSSSWQPAQLLESGATNPAARFWSGAFNRSGAGGGDIQCGGGCCKTIERMFRVRIASMHDVFAAHNAKPWMQL
jgi:hypothetical protein